MAASGNIVTQDGGQGNVKWHPYLFTLVRWCISCLWSTTTVYLHRLMQTQLPRISGPGGAPPRAAAKPRAAGSEHLHPAPRVHCELLHQPVVHTLDVIFVHGLYGSLANTWRQGDWRSKYKIDINFVPLRKHGASNNCDCKNAKSNLNDDSDNMDFTNAMDNLNEATIDTLNDRLKTIEKTIASDQFYTNTLFERVEIIDNYETQAQFVQELFKNEDKVDNDELIVEECDCKLSSKQCEVGCGCVCEECYSACWPRDWIKEDFPGARVISINYTSDPYLWRPLWVKGNKRLRLHERADQMMAQLLEMGVGEKPIVWVGHSKGGLFIKQIYCEAYDAYLEMNKEKPAPTREDNNSMNCDEFNTDNKINHMNDVNEKANDELHSRTNCDIDNEVSCKYNIDNTNNYTDKHVTIVNIRNDDENKQINIDNMFINMHANRDIENNFIANTDIGLDVNKNGNVDVYISKINDNDQQKESNNNNIMHSDNLQLNKIIDNQVPVNEHIDTNLQVNDGNNSKEQLRKEEVIVGGNEVTTTNVKEICLQSKANIWSNSAGFMFYSVPHRGSPLADIKTPITSRSIELLEISKDCSLVVSLQERWLRAAGGVGGDGGAGGAGGLGAPRVRSVVETHRTLMSVLWLRIVSEDSADAEIGTLSGVPVDHREICKPSSRSCLLYKELTDLIHAALNKCQCL